MSIFLVVAAVMAVLAAAAVAVPLMRDRPSRVVGIAAAALVAGAAAALYPLWSTWDWHATPTVAAADPDELAMVGTLESHLRAEPNDLPGWLMLGHSYVALERVDDAIMAYDHAHRLDGANAEAALGLGEAMSMRAGGNITPTAAGLFEQALKAAPDDPKALLYGGFAALSRGDSAAARARWLALKAMHPPQQIEQMLDSRIAQLDAGTGAPVVAAAAAAADSREAAAPNAAAEPAAEAVVTLSIAPALKSRLTAAAPLFVFAREPGGQGPPLAVKRLTSGAIGTQIHLSASDSMVPGRVLVDGHTVSITARVSFSGQPLPAAGDLYGEVTYEVGHDGVRELVIDRVAE